VQHLLENWPERVALFYANGFPLDVSSEAMTAKNLSQFSLGKMENFLAAMEADLSNQILRQVNFDGKVWLRSYLRLPLKNAQTHGLLSVDIPYGRIVAYQRDWGWMFAVLCLGSIAMVLLGVRMLAGRAAQMRSVLAVEAQEKNATSIEPDANEAGVDVLKGAARLTTPPWGLLGISKEDVSKALSNSGWNKMLASRELGINVKTLDKKIMDFSIDVDGTFNREIISVLGRCHGNKSEAARILKVTRQTLINRIRRFNLTY